MFQHTAARRRLHDKNGGMTVIYIVSTHSRAKAAAFVLDPPYLCTKVSTHSRAKAAAV